MIVSSLSLFTFQQKKVISLLEFQESLKKLYCTVLVIPYLLYIILDYSINSLPCHHSMYNFFSVAGMFLHLKITLYFNFERKGLCL